MWDIETSPLERRLKTYDAFPHQGIDKARFPHVRVADGADGQDPLLELEAFSAAAVAGNVDASDRFVDLLLPRILEYRIGFSWSYNSKTEVKLASRFETHNWKVAP